MYVVKSPLDSTGVIYPPSLVSSTTLHPGAFSKHFLIFLASISELNSTFTDSECPTKTGTRTHVALKDMLGSKIFWTYLLFI